VLEGLEQHTHNRRARGPAALRGAPRGAGSFSGQIVEGQARGVS
jgi:hypothetical protein